MFSTHRSEYNNINTYYNTTKEIDKAFTITPKAYYDKDFFDLEKEKIFKNSWIPVGYTNQFSKCNIIPSTIHNIPIILTQNNEGKINSFYNVCRHRGCKIVDLEKKSKVITCPYHKWTYSIDGNLIGTPLYKPDKIKSDFNKKNYPLFPIKTEIQNNLIFANLNNDSSISITDYYKDAFKTLNEYPLKNCIIAKKKNYIINSNWKLLVDNFIEYYHLPAVHPKLVKNSTVNDHICTQGDGMYIGFKTDPLTSSGESIDIERFKKFNNLPDKNKMVAHFHALFPNMFYFLFPNHLFSIIVNPINPDKSIEEAVLIVEEGADKKWVDDLWSFYDEVNLEDIRICEKVQEGIKCDVYNGGKMVPQFEKTIHRFHKMIIEKMCS